MAPVSKTKKTPKPLRPTKQAPKKRYLSLTETLNLRFVPARKVSWKESILFRASYYTETLCQEGRKRAYAIAAYHNGPFRLFDLPDELQLHIFRFVVVRPNTHVWPDMKTGREQHDLTMVDKKTRMKVLPLFYGENIFAFDASPRGFGHRFRTWTEKIGQQNFRHIRQFAIWGKGTAVSIHGGRVPISSLTYGPASSIPITPDDREDVVLSLVLEHKRRCKIEIHQTAACLIGKSCETGSLPYPIETDILSALKLHEDFGHLTPEGLQSVFEFFLRNPDEMGAAKCHIPEEGASESGDSIELD